MADDTPPTEAEIAALPRWARVAFAARCARRVLSLAWRDLGRLPGMMADTLIKTVDLTERSAAAAEDLEPDQYAHILLDFRGQPIADDPSGGMAVPDSMRTAFSAFTAAGRAALIADWDHPRAAAGAVEAAAAAVTEYPGAVRLICEDFRALTLAARAGRWTDDTPVPPTVFGPLWPDGPPPGWPVEASADPAAAAAIDPAPPLRLFFEMGVFSPAEMAEIVGHLSEAYQALGGDRLVIDDVALLDPALVPQPVEV
jgi:hypothetical protein